jgi:hypothetical protein
LFKKIQNCLKEKWNFWRNHQQQIDQKLKLLFNHTIWLNLFQFLKNSNSFPMNQGNSHLLSKLEKQKISLEITKLKSTKLPPSIIFVFKYSTILQNHIGQKTGKFQQKGIK